VALEEHNRYLLRSMDRHADLQLRLQKAIVGLSVAAISYYVLNLKSLHLPTDPHLTALVVAGIFSRGGWRMRWKLTKRGDFP